MTVVLPEIIDRTLCQKLDHDDPLAALRDRFDVDDDVIYLDGNSLGRVPRATRARVDELVGHEWARGLVRGWTESAWMDSPHRVGAKLARLLGAAEDEVLVTDSTSVCLFKLLGAALRAHPERPVILTEHDNFPTDLYVAGGVAALLDGREVCAVARSQLHDALDDRVCALLLTHVDFRTGEQHDMRALTSAAHDAGALTIWDLSHSAGAVWLDLRAAGADLATGCGYKYLNGGPGATAGLYLNRRHFGTAPGLAGWFSSDKEKQFDMARELSPAEGAAAPSDYWLAQLGAQAVGLRRLVKIARSRWRGEMDYRELKEELREVKEEIRPDEREENGPAGGGAHRPS